MPCKKPIEEQFAELRKQASLMFELSKAKQDVETRIHIREAKKLIEKTFDEFCISKMGAAFPEPLKGLLLIAALELLVNTTKNKKMKNGAKLLLTEFVSSTVDKLHE